MIFSYQKTQFLIQRHLWLIGPKGFVSVLDANCTLVRLSLVNFKGNIQGDISPESVDFFWQEIITSCESNLLVNVSITKGIFFLQTYAMQEKCSGSFAVTDSLFLTWKNIKIYPTVTSFLTMPTYVTILATSCINHLQLFTMGFNKIFL